MAREVTAVAYARARSYTVVLHAGRPALTVRVWKRDFERLLRRGDVAVVRRHARGLTLRLGPGAAWALVFHAAGDIKTTAGALARVLRAEREFARLLKMWGVDGDISWEAVPVVVRLRAGAKYTGAYRPVTDTIEILHAASRDHAVEVLLHELAHRAVRRLINDRSAAARLRERTVTKYADPHWANKEELVCELAAAAAMGRGKVERGAMAELALKIAEMPKEEAARLWNYTRMGPEGGPRAAGVTRRGLALAE